MDKNQEKNNMRDLLVPFGAGVAVGGLIVGVCKLLATAVIATGLGLTVCSLFKKNNKELDKCKSGQKQS